jgi:acyl-CoA synthetase (AMP-forming)/AMP-acid ligase II
MYGLTECKRVAYLPPKDLLRKPDSVGRAIPNVEAYIVNENGDRITQPGMIGELIVRGSNIMEGYWNLPEETAKVLEVGASPGQKVLRTGDLFKMDKEYYLYFIARKDDLIKTGGELVSPKEVESIIYELEEGKEVVVFGVEHEILGQVIKVSLVLGNNSKLVEKDIIDYCSLFLEKSMIPKYVEIRSELPKTITGKISHKELLSEMKSSHT